MRRFPAAALGLFATVATLLALVAPASATSVASHNPVIFVHGFSGSSSNWNEMIADFKADGYSDNELLAWDYDSYQSNKTTAEEFVAVINGMLDRTGSDEVDIVTHSMGGLNTRWNLAFLDGTTKVDAWVSLGGPNHGTTSANACFSASCVEMRPGSDFLTHLNDGDETPGTTTYGTWWSPCDETINPDDSVLLTGATNTKTACIGHVALLFDDTVSQQVRDFVA